MSTQVKPSSISAYVCKKEGILYNDIKITFAYKWQFSFVLTTLFNDSTNSDYAIKSDLFLPYRTASADNTIIIHTDKISKIGTYISPESGCFSIRFRSASDLSRFTSKIYLEEKTAGYLGRTIEFVDWVVEERNLESFGYARDLPLSGDNSDSEEV
jgi:hypothetical protein